MRRLLRSVLVVAAAASLSSVAHAECDAPDDSINSTLVANLRQQADTAEMRANTASNPTDRMRWEQLANRLRMQADTQEQNQRTIANAGQQVCQVLSQHNHDNSSGGQDDGGSQDDSGSN